MGRGVSKVGGGSGTSKPEEKPFVQISGKTVPVSSAMTELGAKEWEDSLTDQEKSSVVYYTGAGYIEINTALRYDLPASSEMQQRLDGIDAAIAKSDLKEAISVYRGSSSDILGDGYKTAEAINKSLIGATINDKGFMSTSISKDGSFDHKPMLFKITIPPGKGRGAYVEGITKVKGEKEFLLKRNSNFVITGATTKKSTGQVVVYMQMTDN